VEGEGGDRQKDFLFEVSIRDIFGNAFIPTARQWYGLLQANQLTYTRTGAGGAPVTTGNLSSLISAGSEVAAFTLRHGEEIVIQVPLHVLVDVKEILPTPYNTLYDTNIHFNGDPNRSFINVTDVDRPIEEAFWVVNDPIVTSYLIRYTNGRDLPPLTGLGIRDVETRWRMGLIVTMILANILVFSVLHVKGAFRRNVV